MIASFGLSTGSLVELGIETDDAIRRASALSANAVEVFLQCPPDADGPYLEHLARVSRDSGIPIRSLHAPTFLFERLLHTRSRRQNSWAEEELARYIAAAQLLDAPHLVVHGPPRSLACNGTRLSSSYVSTATRHAELASAAGVLLCIENVDYALLQTAEHVSEHRDRVPEVGYVLDFKSAWKRGIEPPRMAEAMGEQMRYAHVSFRTASPRGGWRYGSCFGGVPDEAMARAVRSLPAPVPHACHVLEVDGPRTLDEIDRSLRELRRLAD